MKNSPETLRKRREQIAYWKATVDPNSFPHAILRICKDCKKEALCDWMGTFLQGSGKPQFKARCRKCHNKYLGGIRSKDGYKAYRRRTRARAVAERKALGIARLGGKCQRCGYSKCLAALTFHHPNDDKEGEGVVAFYEGPLDKFLSEVDKCELLCFNCHMEEHWGRETPSDV
jgi:hypothetical protein